MEFSNPNAIALLLDVNQDIEEYAEATVKKSAPTQLCTFCSLFNKKFNHTSAILNENISIFSHTFPVM